MRHLFFLLSDAILAIILLLPLFLWLNCRKFHSIHKTAWYFLTAVYLCCVYSLVGLPNILYFRLNLHFNFVPFAYMFSDYQSSLLNVLLFLPLGCFLPLLSQRFHSFGKAALFGFCLSFLIETLQIFTFRATDINDLITNTLGTVLGFLPGRLLSGFLPGHPLDETAKHLKLTFLASFLTMFLLHPVVSRVLTGL